jgi:hypothetical protein
MNRVASLLCLVAAASCGGTALRTDAGLTDGATAEAPSPVPTSCDLPAQSPCGASEQCNAFCREQRLVVACLTEPAMTVGLRQPCSSTVQCARGSTCLAPLNLSAQCLKLCTVTGDCPSGMGCRTINVTYNCNPAGPEALTLRACL